MGAALKQLMCAALFVSSLILQGFGVGYGLCIMHPKQQATGEFSGLEQEFMVELANWRSAIYSPSTVRLHPPGFMRWKSVVPKQPWPDGVRVFFMVMDDGGGGGGRIPTCTAVNSTYWWDHDIHSL